MRTRQQASEYLEAVSHTETSAYIGMPEPYLAEIRKFRRWASGPVSFTALTKYFSQMRGAASTKAVAKYALKKLLKHELLARNHTEELAKLDVFFKNIKTGKTNRRVHAGDIIKDREMELIRKKCKPKTALLCEALYGTGLRISELANIRLLDCEVRGEQTHIKITGKGKKERRIMIATKMYDRAILQFASPTHLFGKESGSQYTSRYLRRMVDECKVVLGRRVFPHLFRHSFITNIIAKTGKIKGVSEFVGHSTPAITLAMYCHEILTPEDLFSVSTDRLDAKSA